MRDAYSWKTSQYPPPHILCQLYILTDSKLFLLTRSEKEEFRGRTKDDVLDSPDWPDMPAPAVVSNGQLKELRDFYAQIAVLTAEIGKIAALEQGDPIREHARVNLVSPAMRLYREICALDIEFPKMYTDLLRHLDLAAEIIPRKGKN